jgi:branched-chain amino acid transport system ATP-binding protein
VSRLEIDGIEKRFGEIQALDGVTLEVESGDLIGLIGPNGAGKTTLFNVIMGAIEPTAGTVRFDGREITGQSVDQIVKEGINRTFQTPRPFPEFTVEENLEIPYIQDHLFSVQNLFTSGIRRSLDGEQEAAVTDEVNEILEFANLETHRNQTPDELPHAVRQRLELARAIATEPSLLLLDEPFSGLTAPEVSELADLVRTLNQDRGITTILIDHNLRGVMNVSEAVVVLHLGRVIARGPPEEIQANQDVQEIYLGQ